MMVRFKSCPNVHPFSPSKSSAVQNSPQDEQSILFEMSRPQRLFSEPTFLPKEIQHCCTRKFTSCFQLLQYSLMNKFSGQYISKQTSHQLCLSCQAIWGKLGKSKCKLKTHTLPYLALFFICTNTMSIL